MRGRAVTISALAEQTFTPIQAGAQPGQQRAKHERTRYRDGDMQQIERFVLNHVHEQQMLTQAWNKHELEARAQRKDADNKDGQRGCDQYDAKPGLCLLVALRKRGDKRHDRRAEQNKGRQQQERKQ